MQASGTPAIQPAWPNRRCPATACPKLDLAGSTDTAAGWQQPCSMGQQGVPSTHCCHPAWRIVRPEAATVASRSASVSSTMPAGHCTAAAAAVAARARSTASRDMTNCTGWTGFLCCLGHAGRARLAAAAAARRQRPLDRERRFRRHARLVRKDDRRSGDAGRAGERWRKAGAAPTRWKGCEEVLQANAAFASVIGVVCSPIERQRPGEQVDLPSWAAGCDERPAAAAPRAMQTPRANAVINSCNYMM